jgi:hypothetical protein
MINILLVHQKPYVKSLLDMKERKDGCIVGKMLDIEGDEVC